VTIYEKKKEKRKKKKEEKKRKTSTRILHTSVMFHPFQQSNSLVHCSVTIIRE
jgi:hypothetical protein